MKAVTNERDSLRAKAAAETNLEHSGKPLSKDVVLWLSGLTAAIAIPLASGGKVTAADAIIFLALPVVVSALRKNSLLRRLWIFSLIWSAAQVVSNLVHDQSLMTAPVLAGPTVALLATGLFWMYQSLGISVSSILIATGCGWILLEVVAANALASSNPWKYHLATPLAIVVLALAYKRGWSRVTIAVALIFFAALSRFYDSRVQTALFLVCALAILLVAKDGQPVKRPRRAFGYLALGAVIVYLLYPSVALTGYLGERAYGQQIAYEADGANFVLATRMEFPQMAYLAVQNPTLGIGSYSRVSREESSNALDFVNDNVTPLSTSARSYLVSERYGWLGYRAHSAALSSILYAGILAAPFWIFLLVRNIRGIYRYSQGRAVAPAVLVYMCSLTTWDAFFSPLTDRTHLSLGIVMFILAVVFSRENEELLASDQSRELDT